MKNQIFKPWLIPNFGKGITPDWRTIIKNCNDYVAFYKKEGIRSELFNSGVIKGRSLKLSPSIKLQEMASLYKDKVPGILEAEFYAHGFTFPEIKHFYSSEDVSSDKEIKKLNKLWEKSGQGKDLSIWKFPGRDVEWLTTWHPELKFWIFDYHDPEGVNLNFMDRWNIVTSNIIDEAATHSDLITFSSIDELEYIYEEALENGWEGLVIVRKDSLYKYGKDTIKNDAIFKMKDDNRIHDGQILRIEESSLIKEGVERTKNELGRSVTSKKKEDRKPSGKAGGFWVLYEGEEFKVGLKGFNDDEKREIWDNPGDYIGEWFRYNASPPVKIGGKPRHAYFKEWRDAK